MRFKIKNWKLSLLALLFICFFTSLGFWQISRAHQKRILLKSFAERMQEKPNQMSDLTTANDLRFYKVQLTGTFDNQHTLLLDNKTFHGQVGYEIYTPFHAIGMKEAILIDRGFIPLGPNREILPTIRQIKDQVTIIGMLNLAPTYVAFGAINESAVISWPLRIEFVKQAPLEKLLNYSLFPYVLNLEPHDPAAYSIEWQIVIMGPERHIGYAVQWFALAITLLIIFVALNWYPRRTSSLKT